MTQTPGDLYAPHFADGRFFNPWRRFETRLRDVLRWQLSGKAPYDRKSPLRIPVAENDGAYLKDRSQPSSVTWVGHSTFAVQDEGEVFLTDPHWGPRALLPPRLSPPGIPLSAVPADAFAVLSHNHYDHLDAWTVRRLPRSIPWFVPLGLGRWLRSRGPETVTELDWWQSATYGRWTLTCLPAQHWSNRLGMPRHSTLWCSWLLDNGACRYYFAGDSGYFHGFAEIGRRFGPIDVAFLPIGGESILGFHRTMGPRDAARAAALLKPRRVVPITYGSAGGFPFVWYADDPVASFHEAATAEGFAPDRIVVLQPGESWHYYR
jgi:N-acyl-phosphatidylethanolamine-hydrolysing phospholipase D